MPARLYITSDTRGFDPTTLEAWRAEGFDVTYLPYDGDVEAYGRVLRHLADEMERGERYAIVSSLRSLLHRHVSAANKTPFRACEFAKCKRERIRKQRRKDTKPNRDGPERNIFPATETPRPYA
ncbi:hypothetical protein LTR66_003048 [Elasticomyces elasticus]|nr:hypothetical protein LTR66_003048 [Elasticomyces elasticus]